MHGVGTPTDAPPERDELTDVFVALRDTAMALQEDIERRVSPVDLEKRLAGRFEALAESMREMLDQQKNVHARAVRTEMDRLLYILMGCAGLTLGGALWVVLKP